MPETDRVVLAWTTTPDRTRLLDPMPPVSFEAASAGDIATVQVIDGIRAQQMAGFGAAVTGSSAWLIQTLPEQTRRLLLMEFFSAQAGIGLTMVRSTMGASDFSLTSFTYNDLPPGHSDPLLDRFSLAWDRNAVLPVLRAALAIQPELKIVATPWSAPAWMKTSQNLSGGRLRPEMYAVYAQYFLRFLEEYRDEGVPVWAVTVQNEPDHEAAYPSMRMSAREQAAFVRDHLGPALRRSRMPTRILAWDHNWDNVSFALEVLANAGAADYIDGTAFHCYAGQVEAQKEVWNRHPEKQVHMTECSGGGWSSDFGADLHWELRNLIIGVPRNHGSSVLLWNLALDPQHGPTNGGCQNCRGLVTIDPITHQVERNVEYYALAHASRFVRPGAYRVESRAKTSDLEHVAFLNPDGSKVLILLDTSWRAREVSVAWNREVFRASIEPGAVVTFEWR